MREKPVQFRAPKPMCVYCGVREGTTRDHVIPRALFQPNPTNPVVVHCCLGCNQHKKYRDEYLRDMLAVDALVQMNPAGRTIFEGPYTRAVEGDWSQFTREFE